MSEFLRFNWATVTSVSPLRVRMDGDTTALPFAPDSLVDPSLFFVNDRVRCELSGSTVVIVGKSSGIPSIPTGVIMPTALAAASTGWLLCDGAAVSRLTYAALFSAIGTTYGSGDGSTTFGLPNLKGRVVVGIDAAQTEFNVRGETGGAKTHTLSVAEMPTHNHVSGATARAVLTNTSQRTASAGTQGAFISTTEDIVDAGGGGAHNNLQPYMALHYIIKT